MLLTTPFKPKPSNYVYISIHVCGSSSVRPNQTLQTFGEMRCFMLTPFNRNCNLEDTAICQMHKYFKDIVFKLIRCLKGRQLTLYILAILFVFVWYFGLALLYCSLKIFKEPQHSRQSSFLVILCFGGPGFNSTSRKARKRCSVKHKCKKR